MDLRNRLELAGGALLAMLDPGKDFMPTGGYEVAHDLGRWWDAILRLEETIGFVIPAELEAVSLRNLKSLTDNPDRLLMNRPDVPYLSDKAKINPHNFRETLLAYTALVRRRDSQWAREAGLQLVRSMDSAIQADGSFDFTKLGSWGRVPLTDDPMMLETRRNGWFDATATSGRAIEALLEFHQASGDQLALDLAGRIAKHHLRFSVNPDGATRAEIIAPTNMGHNHSYHGTLRGLLRFGLLTGRQEYVNVVEATYRHADHQCIVKESGWAPHDIGMNRFLNNHGDPVADPASAGDAAQLALWLALEAGCSDLLDEVERLVRARLFPSQLTDNEIAQNPERHFETRDRGAWTIHGPSHGGKGCTPDVLAAVTHTLCDIYKNIGIESSDGLHVNLHFDYEDECVKISSHRDQKGHVTALAKRSPEKIHIRVPCWSQAAEQSQTTLTYDLPERFSEERMPSGRTYRFKWRGDEIVGITPQDEPLPFYPAVS